MSATIFSSFALGLGTYLIYNPLGPQVMGYSLSSWAGLFIFIINVPIVTKVIGEIFKESN